ncbi:uncharacterized protein LOC144163945 [Haemaphysalis longicornis]
MQEDGYWHGYLKSNDQVQHFERSLDAVNVKYSVRTSKDVSNSRKGNVIFSMIHCGRRISVDNIPFRVVKQTAKVCIFGVEYYKKTEQQKNKGSTATDWPKEVFQKKRILLQGTKKKGCTATLHFKHVELYPDFKADIPQPCGRNKEERLKSDKARQLNEALQAKHAVSTECRVYVAVADLDSHCNHGFDEIEAFSHKSASGKRSLTCLIAAVVCGYLPDNEKKFHESTMRQSSLYRQYSDAVPAFLHNRPHSFIRHMLRRLVNAEEYTRSDIGELTTEGAFAVQSERDDYEAHTVEFCKPLCTCPDFAKHKYPCKNFCAVFKHISGWSFASLPDSYRNRPEITLGSCPPSDTSSDVLDLVELPVFEAPQQALHSEREALGNPAASVVRKAIAEELEKCSSLLHYCHDVDALLDTKKMVESAFCRLAECVPHSSGLQIRGSPTKGCSSSKPLPKRKRL